MKEKNEMTECTFKPAISYTSRQLAFHRNEIKCSSILESNPGALSSSQNLKTADKLN